MLDMSHYVCVPHYHVILNLSLFLYFIGCVVGTSSILSIAVLYSYCIHHSAFHSSFILF